MIDKPCQPDHNMMREMLKDSFDKGMIDWPLHAILCDYINDCECLLDPTREDCNDKERR